MEKVRLDTLLFEKGHYPSREKAKAAVMARSVLVDGAYADKAGSMVLKDCEIEIKENKNPYVGRGGLKLKRAIEIFDVDVSGKVFLDVGASTGGFTDCLLKNGAHKVYAIDVGYGQLDYNLRNDERVEVLERTNFRYLEYEKIGRLSDGFVMDVSFISVLKLAENLKNFLKQDAFGIILVKPQFESTKQQIEKNGVIKSLSTHKEVLKNVSSALNEMGYYIKNMTYSDLKGAKGNIEFLFYVTLNNEDSMPDMENVINKTTEAAHKELS
ncbi:MAG: TlyA family RNA methyltransferase [Eubacteriaceae bacterium]